MGIVSTICLVLYGFMSGSNEDLFWSLFAFSAVIFLLPYQGMMLTFLKMRRVDADHPRPYRVPGGFAVAALGDREYRDRSVIVLGECRCAHGGDRVPIPAINRLLIFQRRLHQRRCFAR